MSVYAVSVFGESFPHSIQMRCVPSSGTSLGDGGGSDGRLELTALGGIELLRFAASDSRPDSCLLPGVFELPPVMTCRPDPPPCNVGLPPHGTRANHFFSSPWVVRSASECRASTFFRPRTLKLGSNEGTRGRGNFGLDPVMSSEWFIEIQTTQDRPSDTWICTKLKRYCNAKIRARRLACLCDDVPIHRGVVRNEFSGQ